VYLSEECTAMVNGKGETVTVLNSGLHHEDMSEWVYISMHS
jgi:hypothetical protein